jgi:peptidoglycan/LPS O-acetylase OafA/YrhL
MRKFIGDKLKFAAIHRLEVLLLPTAPPLCSAAAAAITPVLPTDGTVLHDKLTIQLIRDTLWPRSAASEQVALYYRLKPEEPLQEQQQQQPAEAAAAAATAVAAVAAPAAAAPAASAVAPAAEHSAAPAVDVLAAAVVAAVAVESEPAVVPLAAASAATVVPMDTS